MKLYKEKTNFTQVSNVILNDKELSAKAKWLYCYLYSKPDDWEFAIERIAKDFSDGEKAISAWLKELENANYLRRKKEANWRNKYYIWFSQQVNSWTAWKPLDDPKPPKVQDGVLGGLSNTDIKLYIKIKDEEIKNILLLYIKNKQIREKKEMSKLSISKLVSKINKYIEENGKEAVIEWIQMSIDKWWWSVYIKEKPILTSNIQDIRDINEQESLWIHKYTGMWLKKLFKFWFTIEKSKEWVENRKERCDEWMEKTRWLTNQWELPYQSMDILIDNVCTWCEQKKIKPSKKMIVTFLSKIKK